MPANKYALLRYRIIDRCLRSKGSPYPSKEDLRCACEEALYGSDGEHISMSTIDKDIWAMRNESELAYYAPIQFSKDHRGYFYEDPNYTIAEMPLTDDDLDAIKTAAQTLYQFRDIPLFSQFDSAIEKILDRMKISSHDKKQERQEEVIQFEHTGEYQGSEFLEGLYLASKERKQVEFDYRKFNSSEKRTVKLNPYLLKEYKNRWYAIGMDLDKDAIRTFSLDRIVKLATTDRYFTASERFDVRSFFEHAVGITVTDEQPSEVKLQFGSRLAPYIMSQPLHPTQKVIEQSADSTVIKLDVLVTVELISTILGYGDQVEVLAPDFLRRKVKEALTNCLKKY